MSGEQLVTMFYNDTVYTFERSDAHTPSSFGGPLAERFSGLPTGPRPLHMVARLSLDRMPELWDHYRSSVQNPIWTLPLIYGFNYDGCEVKYKIKTGGVIEILELGPAESSEDFPYLNYPLLLPYIPLKLSGAIRCTYQEFSEEIPNMVEEQPAELVVTVPPPATIGVSLWGPGPSGDDNDVTVVFEWSLAERSVKAYTRFIT